MLRDLYLVRPRLGGYRKGQASLRSPAQGNTTMTLSKAIERQHLAEKALGQAATELANARSELANLLVATYGITKERSPWEIEINGVLVRAIHMYGNWEVFVFTPAAAPKVRHTVA